MQKKHYKEISEIIRNFSDDDVRLALENYYASDIADVLQDFECKDRLRVYSLVGTEKAAEIIAFYDDVEKYVEELTPHAAAAIIGRMDSDDAVDVLNELDEDDKKKIIDLLDEKFKRAVKKLDAYPKEYVGSYMSDNFITIGNNATIPTAMTEMVRQAGSHDNIYTLYVVDRQNRYLGIVNLKDLIVSRKDDEFSELVMTSYPYVYDDQLIVDTINSLKEYAELSIPVLNRQNQIIGVITPDTVIEMSEAELGEDYVRLGGLTEEEDLDEPTGKSVRKRIPWLIILLFLGMIVSGVIGAFEQVIVALPVIVLFQSVILDMAGNVGTQSLAITIRNISSDEFGSDKEKKRKSVFKELRISLVNGLIMGLIAVIFVLSYLSILKKGVSGEEFKLREAAFVSLVIGLSMMISIFFSGLIGVSLPLLLAKMKIDPAVASGPFITTFNDIIAVSVYYGLTWLLFLK